MNKVKDLEISYNVGIKSMMAKITTKDVLDRDINITLNEDELKFLLQSLLRNIKFEIN